MPYLSYASLSDEDVKAIVVYLRTIPAVRNIVPVRQLPGPLEYLVNTIPKPVTTPVPAPPSATAVERGRYLVTLAECQVCHTPTDDQGIPLPGLDFGGGGYFNDPSRNMERVYSINITPDPSGIAHYDESLFMQTLRTGQVGARQLNHIMPFEFFRNLADQDLSDMFAYLRTLEPKAHRVSNVDPPTPCPICGQSHGLGEMNVKR
jgi:mono/diheme cytochrome c family protein